MSLVVLPRQLVVDTNGVPRSGAKAYFSLPTTSTPIVTYTTSAYSIQHADPVESLVSGLFPAIYINPAVNPTFKLVIKNSAGAEIYNDDNIPALGFEISDIGLTGPYIGSLLYPRTAAEIAAGVTPINYAIPSHDAVGYSIVDRYVTNTTPGTTNTASGVQAAINIALTASGSGLYGYPVRFLRGAYSIATALTFGGATANVLPLDIGGQGVETQIINNLTAGTSALWPMNDRDGWHLHDFLMCCDSTHANNGIEVGTGSGTTEWRVSRVISMMHGIGIKCSDTNTGVIDAFMHWPGNNPDLIVPQTLTAASISHGVYLTGSFIHNVAMHDCWLLANSGYGTPAASMRGLKMDCTFSFGVVIDGATLAQTMSGNFNEISIEIVPTNFAAGLVIKGLYMEGATVLLKNVEQCEFGPFVNGESGGAIRTESLVRFNKFTGIRVGVIDLTDTTGISEGNVFENCLLTNAFAWDGTVAYTVGNYVLQGGQNYRCILAHTNHVPPNATYWTAIDNFNDGNEGAGLVSTPNELVNSFGAHHVGDIWRQPLTYAASMTIDCLGANHRTVSVTNATAMTFATPLHPRNGAELQITVRNASGGAMGAITWFHTAAGWTNPANGFNRTMCVYYDSTAGGWRQKWVGTVDVAN